MNETLQSVLAVGIVAIAVGVLLWRGWRTFFAKDKSCGCGSKGCEKMNEALRGSRAAPRPGYRR